MLHKENNREIKYKDTEVGRIPEHWDVVRLGDVCEINKKNYKNDKEWIEYLDTGNLTKNRIAGLQKLFSNIDKIPSRAKRLVECKDILISLVRPNQKHFGVLEREIENLVVSTGFAVIAVKEAEVDYKYLYYYLTNEETTNHLQKLAESSVSTYPTLKPSDVEKILIPLPPIEEQQKIAKILSDIDNKIETNNKISQTLETMAQTLFNEWFVEFNFPDANGNPYKKSGGKMVESELGEIPEGWFVGQISDIGDVIGGGTPSKKVEEYYASGEIAWITPKDLSNKPNVFTKNGKLNISDLGLAKSSAKMLPRGTVLLSSRAPIGYMTIAKSNLCTNQGFKSIIPRSPFYSEYIYCLLKSKLEQIINNAGGSTFKEVSGTEIKTMRVCLADEKYLRDAQKTLGLIFEKIERIESEIQLLEKKKETLVNWFFQ